MMARTRSSARRSESKSGCPALPPEVWLNVLRVARPALPVQAPKDAAAARHTHISSTAWGQWGQLAACVASTCRSAPTHFVLDVWLVCVCARAHTLAARSAACRWPEPGSHCRAARHAVLGPGHGSDDLWDLLSFRGPMASGSTEAQRAFGKGCHRLLLRQAHLARTAALAAGEWAPTELHSFLASLTSVQDLQLWGFNARGTVGPASHTASCTTSAAGALGLSRALRTSPSCSA